MPARPGDMTRDIVTRNQRKHQAAEFARQLKHWSDQILTDLRLDHLRADHGRTAMRVSGELYAELRLLIQQDEADARAFKRAARQNAVA